MNHIPTQPDETIDLGTLTVDTAKDPDACIIWLHGLGADGSDFEGIVPQLMLPTALSVRFLFPDAPLRPVTINGGFMMRAWYDIYEDISESAEQDREGVLESVRLISLLIDQQIDAGFNSQRIMLAGFSQGGAIALYSGLVCNKPLAGIVALSTYLPLAHELHSPLASANRNIEIFMGHGRQDPLVPYRYGEHSRDYLIHCGAAVDWHDYEMPHGVCGEELIDIRSWLIDHLS